MNDYNGFFVSSKWSVDYSITNVNMLYHTSFSIREEGLFSWYIRKKNLTLDMLFWPILCDILNEKRSSDYKKIDLFERKMKFYVEILWDWVSIHSLDWPETFYIDKTGLKSQKSTCLCFPSAGISGCAVIHLLRHFPDNVWMDNQSLFTW